MKAIGKIGSNGISVLDNVEKLDGRYKEGHERNKPK
jgi:hypothetical protein